MSYLSNYARKEAFQLVPETCPLVNAALEEAKAKIVEQTEALRAALEKKCEECLELQNEITELQNKIKELE